MKKHGFTLAEVLITLGIIGVIAALTMPLFMQKTQTAKIGPKLGKAIVTFENAMKAIMVRAESDTLTGSYICKTGGSVSSCTITNEGSDTPTSNAAYLVPQSGTFDKVTFMKNINDFVSGSVDSNGVFTDANGVTYTFGSVGDNGFTDGDPSLGTCGGYEASQCKLLTALQIDINGSTDPNQAAKDRFYFYVMEDGTLKPFGSSSEASTDSSVPGTDWRVTCQEGNVPTQPIYCAGHVVEHNMKVEYK